MIFNYLKLALRLMIRNPFFTLINVIGLSVGFVAFFILWQYSESELKSDTQWKNSDRIYRFGIHLNWTDDKVNWQGSFFGPNDAAFTSYIADQYSEIEDYTRILVQKNFTSRRAGFNSLLKDHGNEVFFTVQSGNTHKSFEENKVVYGDPNVFSFFGIQLIEGNTNSALNLSGSVVLSERASVKYFGTAHSLGKTMLLNDQISLTVTGVFKNLPKNTHLDFDIVISSERLRNQYSKFNPAFWGPTCYLRLSKNVNVKDLESRINRDAQKQIGEVSFKDSPSERCEMYFQALHELPFESHRQDFYPTKSKVVLTIFQYTSIAILIMAWINYVNLAISSNRKRMREVAIRKTIGGKYADFIFQFMTEAMAVNIIAVALAFSIIQGIRTPMEVLFAFYIPEYDTIALSTQVMLFGAFIVGVLFTGFYPAIVSLKQSPVSLFGFQKLRNEKNRLGISFTTFQYCVAISLVVLAYSIWKQMEFILNRDIGLDTTQTLVINLPIVRTDRYNTQIKDLVKELKSNVSTSDLTVSQSVPGDDLQQSIELVSNKLDTRAGVECSGGVDENFIPFYKIKMLAGRNFLPDTPADSSSILLSSGTISRLGFTSPEDAIGQDIYVFQKNKATVIGVFEDYKLKPLLNEGYINYSGKPGLALTYKDFILPGAQFNKPNRISLHVQSGTFEKVIAEIEKRYLNFFPRDVFNWYFLDSVIDGKYKQQLVARNQIALFSMIAIGIACLGLLGIISNKAIEKTKEIGIRKVLGAELYQIAQILLSTTSKQLIIATIISIPLASYLTQQYLHNFSEYVNLSWRHYVIPLTLLILLLISTVAIVVWRAAKGNPVDALKHE